MIGSRFPVLCVFQSTYSTQPWLSQFQNVIVDIKGMWKMVIR